MFAKPTETTLRRMFQMAFGLMSLSVNGSKRIDGFWLSAKSLYAIQDPMRHQRAPL